MDKDARQELMSEIGVQEKSGGEIAVPLDLFFMGNNDFGSIGCNIGAEQPAPSAFYATLAVLRDRIEVQDVWVRISDADDDTGWPFTDTVYVISTLSQDEIGSALVSLRFDEISTGWMCGKPVSAPDPRPGFTPYSIWWD